MITLEIPGRPLKLRHLITDFNGTIAEGGRLIPGVDDRLLALSEQLAVTVLTADTFGRVRSEIGNLPVDVVILTGGGEDVAKGEHVAGLGSSGTVALGNGVNDQLMLAKAALGLAVMSEEGTARVAFESADVLFRDVRDALDALLEPQKLVATLRR